MDLRNPSIHKMMIINQRYEPWPEMQDLLDKMKSAEKRALVRAQSCSFP
jgi:spore coat protein CotF